LRQIISYVETAFNVVIPWIVITGTSVASLVYLLYTARRWNQATTQPEVVVDSESRYIRSTAIAQLCASLTFVVLGVPAYIHQLYVVLAGSQSGPVGIETYMTQRLLLIVFYSRCSSTFFVHVAANRCFRRRLISVLRDVMRRRPHCSCRRSRTTAAAGVDISLSPALTWSHGADGDRPPTNGDSRDCFAMVVTTSFNE